MNEDEFITFCKSVVEADGCSRGKSMTFFRAIIAGSMLGRQYTPPANDQNAIDGYEIGVELSKNLK